MRKKTITRLTIKLLKKKLTYFPKLGVFIRNETSGGQTAGTNAGCLHWKGYIYIRVGGKKYYAHRLAWFYVHGKWPKNQIDHINGIKNDNRIKNLRDVDAAINAQNLHNPNKINTTGFLGVTLRKEGYTPQISISKNKINLGTYKTGEEAYKVYLNAKRKLHPGCTI